MSNQSLKIIKFYQIDEEIVRKTSQFWENIEVIVKIS